MSRQPAPPLAGRPPFATDEPDSVYAEQPAPSRLRVEPPPDPNSRTSAYNLYDDYLDEYADDEPEDKHAALAAALAPPKQGQPPPPQQQQRQDPPPQLKAGPPPQQQQSYPPQSAPQPRQPPPQMHQQPPPQLRLPPGQQQQPPHPQQRQMAPQALQPGQRPPPPQGQQQRGPPYPQQPQPPHPQQGQPQYPPQQYRPNQQPPPHPQQQQRPPQMHPPPQQQRPPQQQLPPQQQQQYHQPPPMQQQLQPPQPHLQAPQRQALSVVSPRPGYAAPIATLNLAIPSPAATPLDNRSPQMPNGPHLGSPNSATFPPSPRTMYATPAPSTPHPLQPPATPIAAAFVRPKTPASKDVKFDPAVMRGGSEETLLPKRGEKGDDFWRRFSMVAKEETMKEDSSWLKKTRSGTRRLSGWVWLMGILILAGIGGTIGLVWWKTHGQPSAPPSQPHAFGGSANEKGVTSVAPASTAKAKTSSSLHVSPTNTVARRYAYPAPLPTGGPLEGLD